MARTPQEQLVHFLSDMYSVEQQALTQMTWAPKLAADDPMADAFRLHEAETRQHIQLIGDRLEAQGGSPSVIKDAIMKLGGKSFVLFAAVQPQTPGKLLAHAYSYEAMEWAGHELLIRFARAAGDEQTLKVAQDIRDQERVMMQRLERSYDAAEAASHADVDADDLRDRLCHHLAEAHALVTQSVKLLQRSVSIAGSETLGQLYDAHLQETRRHAELLEQRLSELDSSRSRVQDAALALGGLNWSLFFQSQSDTPAKLAAFVFAVEHLEIAGYELLHRTARRSGDAQTQQLSERVVKDERAMADRVAAAFDAAVEATLNK